MRLESVQITDLRCLRNVEFLVPSAGVWLVGPNGAGKTSVLEGLCLLGFGRSFRGRVAEGLLRQGSEALEVVARWTDETGRCRVSGLRHRGDSWEARQDGCALGSLSELAATFPVLCFHPLSTQMITGPAEERRRTLDWLAFHVEPRFAEFTRRYARALKQRNILLREAASDSELEPWEQEMARTAEGIGTLRSSALALWQPALDRLWPEIAVSGPHPVLAPRLELRPGWRSAEGPLADFLLLNRRRDRELGYTTIGPQRADLGMGSPFGVETSQLSRGQSKLLALALLLALAQALRAWTGKRSLLLLDDLQSELDIDRQVAVLDWVRQEGYQVFISGTRIESAHRERTLGWAVFHVEHGDLREEVNDPAPSSSKPGSRHHP